MGIKSVLSVITLLGFVILAGGSVDDGEFFIWILVLVFSVTALIAKAISSAIKSNKKGKRAELIKEDEKTYNDFDRSASIGDDEWKIYFDSNKKQIMIISVKADGISREIVDDFEFPGKQLTAYHSPSFSVYDPVHRKLLCGQYKEPELMYNISNLEDNDENIGVKINNTIPPILKTWGPNYDYNVHPYDVLIDECHGFIAVMQNGALRDTFNYVNAASLPDKIGEKSTINVKVAGTYMFIVDDFFKVLVIITKAAYKIFKFSDIIGVSYEENGAQIFSKSIGRTIGGAIAGGTLMGGAGAIVGGLSGASKENKEISRMNIKILQRNTDSPSFTLYFMNPSEVLKTKNSTEKTIYEHYLREVNKAKDLLCVIIDSAKQTDILADSSMNAMNNQISQLSIADELRKLAALKEDGILSEDEFNIQKAKLLGK